MYRIVICEDDPSTAAQLRELTESILTGQEIAHATDVVASGEQLLRLLDTPGYKCHMILLDMILTGMTGLDAARALRAAGHSASILIVSATDRFAVEGYDIQASAYILKPVRGEALQKHLLEDYRTHFLARRLVLPQRSQVYSIPFGEIRYIEIADRRLAIHAGGQTVSHSAGIDEIQGLLPPHLFVRCHKSYLVNLEHVSSIRRYRAGLRTGEQIPVSKARYDHVRHRFTGGYGQKEE